MWEETKETLSAPQIHRLAIISFLPAPVIYESVWAHSVSSFSFFYLGRAHQATLASQSLRGPA